MKKWTKQKSIGWRVFWTLIAVIAILEIAYSAFAYFYILKGF